MTGKIYCISNTINDKVYIGKTTYPTIEQRFKEHCKDCKKITFEKRPLYSAMNKYGIEHFNISLVEEVELLLLEEREKYWIKFYKSNNKDFGYNISEGGDGADIGSNNHEAKFTEEEIQSIYSDLKEKLTVSIEELANKYGVHITTMCTV